MKSIKVTPLKKDCANSWCDRQFNYKYFGQFECVVCKMRSKKNEQVFRNRTRNFLNNK